jgi:CPW-WPC domain-containing protein
MARTGSWVLFALFAVGNGLSAIDDRIIVQSVGNALTKLNEGMKAADNQQTGGATTFQRHSAETLLAEQTVLTNTEVADAVYRANSLAEKQTMAADALCKRDWTRPCPDGWDQVSASTCLAPQWYQGGCAKKQGIVPASSQSKAAFALECKAPWPCLEPASCSEGHDYEACPVGWTEAGDGSCAAANLSASRCSKMYKFAGMSVDEKQELAVACNLTWRCKVSCQRDFSAACPEGWEIVVGLCMAPPTYAGDCSYSVNTTLMDETQKKSFAQSCALQFPCEGTSDGLLKHPTTKRKSLDNGPVDSQTGQIVGSRGYAGVPVGESSETEGRLKRFQWRFQVPSGPIASDGNIHF